MRILLTVDPEIPVPPKLYGGIERIVDGLIQELRRRGHEIGLLANPESNGAVDFFVGWQGGQSQKGSDTLKNTFTLLRAAAEFQPTLIHSFARLMYLLPLLPRGVPKIMSYQRSAGGKQIRIAGTLGGRTVEFTGCSEFIAAMGRPWGLIGPRSQTLWTPTSFVSRRKFPTMPRLFS